MIDIRDITPTVFFRRKQDKLEQRVAVTLYNDSEQVQSSLVVVLEDQTEIKIPLVVPQGESCHPVFIIDRTRDCQAVFSLEHDEATARTVVLPVQRKWVVHVVQTSHHDPGYTDMPHQVLIQHDHWIDQAVALAERTDDYPEDARFRIVIEQAWSIDHYLRSRSDGQASKALRLLQEGRFELTALFGNLTTELCGHETLSRAVGPAVAISRRYGIPLVSAEHNDITGISWGLARVLADAGIRIFCPGLPLYYSWGQMEGLQSFWDAEKIFGRKGPGAFWWVAPDGRKILFWSNNSGCGGPCRGNLPGLTEALGQIEQQGYPWTVFRWPVIGGARDNSPYLGDYADSIRAWNEQWAYPHLVCSTNTLFYQDLLHQDLNHLPVWQGELPGQDYPSGATSTAAATATCRNAQKIMLAGERFAAVAAQTAARTYPVEPLNQANEHILWHDEHAWGFHFPCGPAHQASRQEKALHASVAEALAHGVLNKAMAHLADQISFKKGYHLVVFNAGSSRVTAPVRTPFREIDNSGSEMNPAGSGQDSTGTGYLKGYLLNNRWHTILPESIVQGHFRLIDLTSGRTVPFQIQEIESAMAALPFAAERLGLGSGTRRYGGFEQPDGIRRDLCFIASDVPSMGYRSYRLEPCAEMTPASNFQDAPTACVIENEFYRVETDQAGSISSLYDKRLGCELVDRTCEHSFFHFLVRSKNELETTGEQLLDTRVLSGPVFSTIRLITKAFGHPQICKEITVFQGIRRIDLSAKILKDSTPLLNGHIAFPFAMREARYRYEGCQAVMEPIRDYLPGSFADTIAIQNWLKISGLPGTILFSPLDAPLVGLGRLWPGYVSPAHRCVVDKSMIHRPQSESDLNTGWVYSQLFNNNFGTNFSVSQTGEMLFRYVLSSCEEELTDDEAATWGWQAVLPLQAILTDRGDAAGGRPVCGSFLQIDNPAIVLLAWKQAEQGAAWVLRLWNMAGQTETASVSFPFAGTVKATRSDITESVQPDAVSCEGESVQLQLTANEIATWRVYL